MISKASRGGRSVLQLDRQIGNQFYEKLALPRNKDSMLQKGESARQVDHVTPDEATRDRFVLVLSTSKTNTPSLI
jgi:predicted nuclease of restriction endonuclease-like (RecB) superfamily